MYNFLEKIPAEVYRAYFPDTPLNPEIGLAINSENPNWDNHPIPRLSEKCVRTLARFFSVKPVGATYLRGKDRALFLNLLSTSESIKLTVEKIEDEVYWKRCCLTNLGITHCNVSEHGNSWKRLYTETHIQKLIEKFVPCQSDINELRNGLQTFEPYIKRLHIEELLPPPTNKEQPEEEFKVMSDISIGSLNATTNELDDDNADDGNTWNRFDFSSILSMLSEIRDFSVCYRIKKIGTEFRWEMFRMTMRDSTNLSVGLRSLKKLQTLTIKNSRLDDEMMYEIYDGIRVLHNLSVLHFPNNVLTDDSIDTLVKVMSLAPVRELDLTNNKISCEGAKTLALFLTGGKSRLAKINLSLNVIRDPGCALLCKAISLSRECYSLNISSNRLGFESAASFREMLKLSSSMRELIISCNPLGQEGGKVLLEGVKASVTIRKLDLRLTGVSKEVDLSIQVFLKANKKKLIHMSTSSSSSVATSSSTASNTKKKSPRTHPKAAALHQN